MLAAGCGFCLEAFVLPWIYRHVVAEALIEAQLSWWAGHWSMLSIRLPDCMLSLAVGCAKGWTLPARSTLLAASCALTMVATSLGASWIYTGFDADFSIQATQFGWCMMLIPLMLLGAHLGRRLGTPATTS